MNQWTIRTCEAQNLTTKQPRKQGELGEPEKNIWTAERWQHGEPRGLGALGHQGIPGDQGTGGTREPWEPREPDERGGQRPKWTMGPSTYVTHLTQGLSNQKTCK